MTLASAHREFEELERRIEAIETLLAQVMTVKLTSRGVFRTLTCEEFIVTGDSDGDEIINTEAAGRAC